MKTRAIPALRCCRPIPRFAILNPIETDFSVSREASLREYASGLRELGNNKPSCEKGATDRLIKVVMGHFVNWFVD